MITLQKDNEIYWFDNTSPMYPSTLEEEINKVAGEKICKHGAISPMPGILPGFTNSFSIDPLKNEIFEEKVLPQIDQLIKKYPAA